MSHCWDVQRSAAISTTTATTAATTTTTTTTAKVPAKSSRFLLLTLLLWQSLWSGSLAQTNGTGTFTNFSSTGISGSSTSSGSGSSTSSSGGGGGSGNTLRDAILSQSALTQYASVLTKLGLLDTMLADSAHNYTVFAPSNTAIQKSPTFQLYLLGDTDPVPRWHDHLAAVARNAIVPNMVLTSTTVWDHTVLTTIDNGNLTVNAFLKRIDGAAIVTGNIGDGTGMKIDNGILHIMDAVMEPLFIDSSLEDLEKQPEFGPDYLQRTSLLSVVDFTDSRYEFGRILPSGMTQVGCRIRAFNRIGDYILQNINWSKAPNVIDAELLNASRINDTITQFIEYNLLGKNYYYDEIGYGFEELTAPINNCANMWITKSKAHSLCFNDACVVATPDVRTFLASNGVGYVVDKCLLCPGVAMLTTYAANYVASYNMLDASQFFISSEWNLRNLSESVGDGGPVTLFAATNEGWFDLHQDDHTRLLTEQWQPHEWDFLRHMMVQGNYTMEAIELLWEEKGDFNFTSLAGQDLMVTKDKGGNLTVAGGAFVKADIRGIDGYVHFTSKLPMVRSVVDSVYGIAVWMGIFQAQCNLINSVFLYEDLNRLLPLTAMYAPDHVWQNQIIPTNSIEHILENHIIEQLMWCDTLRQMKGKEVSSLNGENWLISVNSQGDPCFDTPQDAGKMSMRACITTCDILARNGIVHELNTIMLQTSLKTRGPSPPIPPTFKAPSMPTGADNLRFPTTAAPVFSGPTPPVNFGRPLKQYTDDVFTSNSTTDDVWSDASRTKAAGVAALLPVIAALL